MITNMRWYKKTIYAPEEDRRVTHHMFRCSDYEGGFAIVDSTADICIRNTATDEMHGYEMTFGGNTRNKEQDALMVVLQLLGLLRSGVKMKAEFSHKHWLEFYAGCQMRGHGV